MLAEKEYFIRGKVSGFTNVVDKFYDPILAETVLTRPRVRSGLEEATPTSPRVRLPRVVALTKRAYTPARKFPLLERIGGR